jgi:hypothetical protein
MERPAVNRKAVALRIVAHRARRSAARSGPSRA